VAEAGKNFQHTQDSSAHKLPTEHAAVT